MTTIEARKVLCVSRNMLNKYVNNHYLKRKKNPRTGFNWYSSAHVYQLAMDRGVTKEMQEDYLVKLILELIRKDKNISIDSIASKLQEPSERIYVIMMREGIGYE